MKQSFISIIGILSALGVLIFMYLTSPSQVGPFGVLGVFLFSYIALTCLLFVALDYSIGLLTKLAKPSKLKTRLESTPRLKLYYYASILSLAPVILVGMQSVGGVRLMDFVLLVIFEFLACLYVHKRF